MVFAPNKKILVSEKDSLVDVLPLQNVFLCRQDGLQCPSSSFEEKILLMWLDVLVSQALELSMND